MICPKYHLYFEAQNFQDDKVGCSFVSPGFLSHWTEENQTAIPQQGNKSILKCWSSSSFKCLSYNRTFILNHVHHLFSSALTGAGNIWNLYVR